MNFKMYIATNEWDMDKCRWVIAKDRKEAEKLSAELMDFDSYKYEDEDYLDYHILFEIPPEVLQMLVDAEINNKKPNKIKQRNVNYRNVGNAWVRDLDETDFKLAEQLYNVRHLLINPKGDEDTQ